jgi:hypothetical protein
MGESTEARVRRLAGRRDELAAERVEVTSELRDAVAELAASGMAEVDLAKLAGVDRNTVRTWLGKQDQRNRARPTGEWKVPSKRQP